MTAPEQTDYPEDAAISEVINSMDDDSTRDDSTTDDILVDGGPGSSWAWLVVGLIAGLLAVIVTKVVVSEFRAPLPAEYAAAVNNVPEGEVSAEATEMEQVNRRVNHGRWIYSLGATMAIVFGWAAGVINRRITWGLIGALAGIALAVVMGMFLSSPLLDFEEKIVVNRESSDLNAMLLHAIQWTIIGLPIAVAVGVGTGRVTSGLKVVGAVALAAIVGGVIYVIGGTLLDPTVHLVYAKPVEGNLSYLWHCVPPLLCGFSLSRSRL